MKKIILVVSAVLLSTGAFAQQRGFEWGVKAGLNLANWTKTDDAKFRPGLVAGVFGEYVINDFLGVQGELLYSMQGFKVKEDGETATNINDYLVLPILAKFYILEGLSVDIGPQFGYMLSAKVKYDGDSESYYDEDGLKKFDVSVGMGLSYKLNFGLDVFARYNLGLTKIGDGDSKVKNSVINIGVGYRF